MKNDLFLMVAVFLILASLFFPATGYAEAEMTQRDWMHHLVESLGWSYGLPSKPTDGDYLHLLSGQRNLRIEAEDTYRVQEDRVSVKNYSNFGSFSGDGWLSGISMVTPVHLHFVLPHAGHYRLSARVRQSGFRLELAGERFQFDGREVFTLVPLGEVDLEAGDVDVLLDLPPGGAIDYLELSAPPLGPISPQSGWQLDASVTAADMAKTVLQSLGLQGWLPPSGNRFVVEAETLQHPGLDQVTIGYMGKPSGGRWLRNRQRTESVVFFLPSLTEACYSLRLRAMGTTPVEVSIGDLFRSSISFDPYLSERELGSFFLPQEGGSLTVVLPPEGGVDRLELIELRSTSADLKRLVGLPVDAERLDERQVNELLKLVAHLSDLRPSRD